MGNCIFRNTIEPALLEKKPVILSPKKHIELVEIVSAYTKDEGADNISDLRIKIPATNIDAS
jgi:hypothetical protein